MKLARVISILIVIFNSVKAKSTETIIESKTDPDNISSKTTKDRLMPKISIKDVVTENSKVTYVMTTRRPLMRSKIFTSKPHAVHYIPSRPFGNLNAKKRSKSQNSFNKIGNADSVEDRFRNFTNIDIDEPKHNKRRGSSRRVHSLTAAASINVKSVALPILPYTDNVRLKAKLAIQQSLQKIKSIRPGVNEIVVTTDASPSKLRDSTKRFFIEDAEKYKSNIINANVTIATDNQLHFATTTEKTGASPNATEKSVLSATKTGKLVYTVTTTGESDDSAIKTEKMNIATVIKNNSNSETEKSVSFPITTDRSDISVSEIINPIETITDNNIVASDRGAEPIVVKEQTFTSSEVVPITENGLTRTTGISSRHKRHINIIEEERTATTSTGFKYDERGIPINTDFTYRNIHT